MLMPSGKDKNTKVEKENYRIFFASVKSMY